MTEQEFLEKRIPIWLEGDDLHVSMPSNMDKKNMHAFLSKKYGYSWLFAIRGYYWPDSHVTLYMGQYETPNCTTLVAPYLFNYFKDINYVGFGCYEGKPGEIWDSKITVVRDKTCLNPDILKKY